MALAVLVLLSSVVLGAVSAMTAALTLAAMALIVPGTGTHNINPPNAVMGYKENARGRFMTTTPCVGMGCTLIGVDYPASSWPIPLPGWCPGLSCATWNESVGDGVANLNSQLIPLLGSGDIVIFGYSQGGAVVSNEMYNLAGLPQTTKDQITVVTIGNIEGPQGLWTRLSFLPTIPILNVTFCCTLPTDIGIKSVNYNFEYDPVGDAPLYLLNPLALLNALAAFQYVHGNYLVPNSNAPDDALPYGYDDASLAAAIADPDNIRTYQDGTFILIPQQGNLPIYQPFADLAQATGTTALVQPILDLISPVTKVLIDLGYDRTLNPGIPQTFRLFPIVNPLTLTVDLINAGIEGIQAFVNDLGGLTLEAPVPSAPTTGPPTLAAASTPRLEPQQLSLSTTLRSASAASLTPARDNSPAPVDLRLPSELANLTLPKTPAVKLGNLFRPGRTTSAPSQTDPEDAPPTGTTTTTPDTTEADTTPPASGTPAAGENSLANAPQAAAA